MTEFEFHSALEPYMTDLIKYKRALGYRYDEGIRITYHQVLKTYMGHSFFKYTAYYLRLTKDMFPDIRQKIELRFRSLYERGERHD